ncbi:hypothetical protein JAAARDRAFT_37628 [Jaapia argillacea MUCL 33604]|uniref:F-box domain-containing protein n=1 Tax=Jaapia argillacea MUCL 33604 TaxID=933084 RepID=A0A067PXN3_9AGAM|nr:hypothetical protein JAAARDRAFT_37628 [Jaapia argillacea MUCL 33604]
MYLRNRADSDTLILRGQMNPTTQIVKLFRRFKNRSQTARATSSATELVLQPPPEVVILVFRFLCSGSSDLEDCISRQVGFASSLRVCRVWHRVGLSLDLLYSRPIVGVSSIPLLLRTLKGKRELACRVRTIVIVVSPPEHLAQPSFSLAQLREISKLFKSCSSLDSLAIHPVRVVLPFEGPQLRMGVMGKSSILQNLTRLAFDGLTSSYVPFFAPTVHLPRLEEITMTSIPVGEDLIWPSCPSLRRIRLERCRFTETATTIPLPPVSLKQLDIDQCWADDDLVDISNSLYPFVSSLEVLRIYGVWVTRQIHHVDYSRFTRLRHLSLSLDEDHIPLRSVLDTVCQTPQLEEVVFTTHFSNSETTELVVYGLEVLLEFNHPRDPVFPSLCSLVIQAENMVWRVRDEHDDRLIKLYALCHERGIELKLRELQGFELSGCDDGKIGLACLCRWGRDLGLEDMLLDNQRGS